jgi:hypothetical protein
MKTLTIAGASAVLALHSLAAYAGDGGETTVEGRELDTGQIAALRAYCRQWIMWGWDRNPHAGDLDHAWLARMRADVDELTTRAALANWIERATARGLDPL